MVDCSLINYMYKQLKENILRFISLEDNEWEIIQKAFEFRKVSKKEFLCKDAAVSKEIFFVKKGLLRLYYNIEGNEITAFLFTENLFASAYESFLSQKPSNQILETIEDCELLVLSFDSLEKLYKDLPKFNILTRKVTEQRFINAQNILSSHLLEIPEVRVKRFIEHFPDLLQRVPQHIIASYLGVTAVSFSRIRNRK